MHGRFIIFTFLILFLCVNGTEFKYSPFYHNVVAVDSDGYNNCAASTDAEELKSGKDRITLSTGTYYFICSRFDHCSLGMKIAVTAV